MSAFGLLPGRGRVAAYRDEIRRLRTEVEQLEGLVSDQQAFIAIMASKIEALEAGRDDGYVKTPGAYHEELRRAQAERDAASARARKADEQARRESKVYPPIRFE